MRALQSAVSSPDEFALIQWCTSLTEKCPYLSARVQPFLIGVYMDADEVTIDESSDKGTTNEAGLIPGGIVGFSLTYFLQC